MKFLSDILARAGLVVDGTVTLNSVANATTDTDKFIVVDSGVVKYRTGAQLLSDIGGQVAGSYVPTSRTLTINGVVYDLSADRTWTITAGVSSVTAGTGISVNQTTGAITVTNTGLLSATAGSGISVSTVSQNLNIVNTGLLSATAGSGISVSTTSQNVNIVNTGLLSATAGAGISVSVVSGNLNIVNTITDNNQLANGAGYATTSYVTTQINNLVAGAPGLLDTLDELAAALGDDPNFATTITTALSNRLRVDTATQGLTGTQQSNGRTNLGLGSLATLSSIGNSYITDLAWSKITGAPAFITGNQNITLSGDVTGSGATSIVTTIANNAITTAKINNGAVTAAKLATFGAGEGLSWAANTDGASIIFESTGDGASGGRALSNLLIALTDNGDEGLKVTSAGAELFYVNTNQLQYKGSNIWTAANLTNLNQLTNGPGYITSSGSITGSAGSLSDDSGYIRTRGGGTEANIDTYTDNGVRSIAFTGYSQHLLSWNVGGSPGTIQQMFHYNTPANGWRIRNKTDNNTWSSWGYVVMTSANQGLISGTIATQSWVQSQGYASGGPFIPVSANTNATGWISFSSSTQGTPIIKAIQQDTSAGYYLFQGITGSTEVFRVDRSGGAYFASTIQTDGNIYISNNGGRLYFDRPNGATVGAVGWHTNDVFYLGGHPDYGPGAGNHVRVYGFGGNLYLGNSTNGDVIGIDGTSGAISINRTITSSTSITLKSATTAASLGGFSVMGAGEFMSTGSLAGYFFENRSGGTVTSSSNWYGWYATSSIVRLFNGSTDIVSINGATGAATFNSSVTAGGNFTTTADGGPGGLRLTLNNTGTGEVQYALLSGGSAGTGVFGIRNGSTGTNLFLMNGTGAATFSSSVTASSFVKSGGTASQFLKADGSVDTNAYLTVTSSDFTYNASLTLSTSWQDTGVSNSNLSTTGVYIVTCYASDFASGGSQYQETYVGTMYWYAGSTNSVNYAEISLHHMGHADNDRYIYLRTRTTPSGAGSFLQIRGNGNNSSASTYTFTFKRLL